MSDRTLQDISDGLLHFHGEITHLKETDPLWYDEHLKIPTWQQNDKIEDYSNDILADSSKFMTHIDMLLHPDTLTLDENVHKQTLVNLSERLVQHIQLYTSYNRSKINMRYQQLLADLKNIQKILQKLSIENTRKPPKLR